MNLNIPNDEETRQTRKKIILCSIFTFLIQAAFIIPFLILFENCGHAKLWLIIYIVVIFVNLLSTVINFIFELHRLIFVISVIFIYISQFLHDIILIFFFHFSYWKHKSICEIVLKNIILL